MKNIILSLSVLLKLASWSPAEAQVGLRLDQEKMQTDQPAVIFITTKQTPAETSIYFSQVFQCARFQNNYCADYLEGTLGHDVELHFRQDPIENVYITFHVIFDITLGKFLFKVNSSSYSDDQFIIDRQANKTIITLLN